MLRLADLPNIIGLKDGLGQMERLLRQRQALGDRLCFMNGMPTAELSAPAFAGLGIRSYSSSVYNFVPALASEFYRALCNQDVATMARLIERFYRPFVELRDTTRGYTVSLLKVGLEMVGRPVGPVRPPLVAPLEEHRAALRQILARVGALSAIE
ncbi:MAG: hypothetical protein EHM71_11860 [Zetaproteobacteria bacterium]|nr:MAG: hypothetical protein EHM71_11860 [Zetaproteobacteria bacterium]